MTEMEWSLRRRVPSIRAHIRSASRRATDYVAVLTWLVICCTLWSVVAHLFWRWFVSVPFGVRPINVFEAIGLAMLGSVFREAAFGDTQQPAPADILTHARKWALVLALGWIAHFFVGA